MAKEELHPIQKICSNCVIIRSAVLKSHANVVIPFNSIPYNCPVARGLFTMCRDGRHPNYIKDNYKVIENEGR